MVKSIDLGTEDMAQLRQGLTGMHEAPGSVPAQHKLGVVVHPYSPSPLRHRQEHQKCKDIFGYISSLRSAWAA